jgi:hypothetical protein
VNAEGMRKAALALAAMHPADRRWMLSRLPVEWQGGLLPLIDEAGPMVRATPELALLALTQADSDDLPETPGPVALIATLDRLPAPWAARMLAAAAPDHAEMYRTTCHRDRSDAIGHEMTAGARVIPPALARALAIQLNEMSRVSTGLGNAP